MIYDVYMPEYYQKFQCLGGACQNTCCQRWGVPLTKGDYDKLRNLRAGKELEAVVTGMTRRRKDGGPIYAELVFDSESRCPCLSGEGLCGLQQACGYEVLPDICKQFPRLVSFFEEIALGKRSCTPGCEVVVRFFLEETEGLGFIHEQVKGPEPRAIVYQSLFSKAPVLGRRFWEIQAALVDILQNRAYRLEERMLLMGLSLREFQTVLEEESEASLARWQRKAALMGQGDSCRGLLSDIQVDVRLSAASHLRIIRDEGSILLPDLKERILTRFNVKDLGETEGGFSFDTDAVARARAFFAQSCPQGEILLENLMVNYLFQDRAPFEQGGPWESFQLLASIFSLLRFVMVAVYTEDSRPDDLVAPVTQACRSILHSASVKNYLVEFQKATESDSLAHMALLVLG